MRARDLVRSVLRPMLGPVATQRLAGVVSDRVASIQWATTADGRQSAARLASYRDRFAGERCVIIGNGPSLKQMDLSVLRGVKTFGLNRIYLLFDQLGFTTSFLVSVNRFVIEQCRDEMRRLTVPTFLHWNARRLVPQGEHVSYLPMTHSPGFSSDPTVTPLWDGATVTYVAMQLAFFFGFREVVLIGVDHAFATSGPAHQLVTSTGEDPNHFHPAYFGKGFRWQLPDLEMSEIAYRMARAQFEGAGRTIVDATVGGKLQVFPKATFEALFPVAGAGQRVTPA